MPIRQLDRAAIRREARELIRTARVSPIKFTLLFLAVSLALSLLDTALTSLTGRIVGVAFVSVSFASILIGLITQVLDAGYKCYCLGASPLPARSSPCTSSRAFSSPCGRCFS